MTTILRMLSISCLLLASAFGSVGTANAADPEKKLAQGGKSGIESAFGLQVKSSEPSRIPGLLEVITDRGIIYTDPNGEYVIANAILLETKTKANLTAQRQEALSAYSFDAFPINDAIKVVKGNGSRKLVVFEDPNCGFCKRFEQNLEKVDDVTAYVFLTPVLGADSTAKSKAVWCAPDRSKAWRDLMLSGVAPNGRQDCETPITRNLALFNKLNLRGTPSVYFQSGYHTPGAMTTDEIEKQLSAPKKTESSKQ